MATVYAVSVFKKYYRLIAAREKTVEYRGRRLCPRPGDILLFGVREQGVWRPALYAVVKACERRSVAELDVDASVRRLLEKLYGGVVSAIEFEVRGYIDDRMRRALERLLEGEKPRKGSRRLTRYTSLRVAELLKALETA